eukprot:CAMPEP_0170520986 /NCGR_PEP_ID=MMETSP0209-20121228/6316_1 /TAXON_ID=665100 ORGANISM="Litonotus pictus, Strain P1" /NCGR_SAMPLE_ID=MMETSP0209 /ASSEMBLY_ACC=CAM_ASM_000301 /LENGTH=268 /DNA_ID=CAMNT_0010807609 /DNA_START=87 /DNA_END=893 /DNA_ORIENTATION=+
MRHKTTVASWETPNDPHIYGKVKINVTKIDSYLEDLTKKLGKKITYTLYSIKLLALVLGKFPELNSFIKYGLLNAKDSVDVCCLVAIGDGNDLANSVIRGCDRKTIEEIHDELQNSVHKLRTKKDENHNKKNRVAMLLPNFILALIVQITSYIASIGIGFKPFGVTPFEFGSCVITSIGSLGIEEGYPPIPPPTFCPLLVSVCKKNNSFYYDTDHKVQEKATIGYNFTADFRFLNQKTTKQFIDEFRRIGENPLVFEEESRKAERKSK